MWHKWTTLLRITKSAQAHSNCKANLNLVKIPNEVPTGQTFSNLSLKMMNGKVGECHVHIPLAPESETEHIRSLSDSVNNPQAHLSVSLLLMLLACHFNTVFSDQPKTLNLFTPLYDYTASSRKAQGCSDRELHNHKEKNLKMSHSCLLHMIWVCNAVIATTLTTPCCWKHGAQPFNHPTLHLIPPLSPSARPTRQQASSGSWTFFCGFISLSWSPDRSDKCQCWSTEQSRSMQH